MSSHILTLVAALVLVLIAGCSSAPTASSTVSGDTVTVTTR